MSLFCCDTITMYRDSSRYNRFILISSVRGVATVLLTSLLIVAIANTFLIWVRLSPHLKFKD